MIAAKFIGKDSKVFCKGKIYLLEESNSIQEWKIFIKVKDGLPHEWAIYNNIESFLREWEVIACV